MADCNYYKIYGLYQSVILARCTYISY